MLTPENKQARLTTSRDNLSPYKSDPAKFLCRYVTMDETLATQFDPETRLQSKAWKHPTSPPAVKFHRIASVGKVMACVLWDSDGVLMNDYLERGQTVTAIYYAALIRKLCAVVSTSLSVAAFLRRAGGSMLESTGSHGRGVERRVPEMRRMVQFNCTSTRLV